MMEKSLGSLKLFEFTDEWVNERPSQPVMCMVILPDRYLRRKVIEPTIIYLYKVH
jgi:hypothetical protein